MDLIKRLNSNIKKMKWRDIPILKMAVFFATLFVITIWPGFRNFVLGIQWYWYFILMLVFMAPLMKKLLWD